MLRRVEGEEPRERSHVEEPSLARAAQIVPVGEAELETSLLPRDHPQWAKDTITISTRARELLSRLRPLLVTVLTFWDHRIRCMFVAGGQVSIDPTGSYRME